MEETKIAGWGTEIPHALEQLDCAPQLENLRATTAEAHMLWSLSAASAEPTRHRVWTRQERSCTPQQRSQMLWIRPDAAK